MSTKLFDFGRHGDVLMIAFFISYFVIMVYYSFNSLNGVRLESKTKQNFYKFIDPLIYAGAILMGLTVFGMCISHWEEYINNVDYEIDEGNEGYVMDNMVKWVPVIISILLIFPIINYSRNIYDMNKVFKREYGIGSDCQYQKLKSSRSISYDISISLIASSLFFLLFSFVFYVYLSIRNWTLSGVTKDSRNILEENSNLQITNYVSMALMVFNYIVTATFWTYWGCKVLKTDYPWLKSMKGTCTTGKYFYEIRREDASNLVSNVVLLVSLILSPAVLAMY